MKGMAKSRGFTLISFACAAVTFIVLVLIAFKVAPAYIENYSIVDSLNTLQAKIDEKSSQTILQPIVIRKALGRLFDVNSIRAIEVRDAEVRRHDQGYEVSVKYDVNVDLVGNISLLIHFNDSVVITENAS